MATLDWPHHTAGMLDGCYGRTVKVKGRICGGKIMATIISWYSGLRRKNILRITFLWITVFVIFLTNLNSSLINFSLILFFYLFNCSRNSVTAYQMVGMMVKEMFMFVCQNCTVITIETTPTGEWIVIIHSCTDSPFSLFYPHTPRCEDLFVPFHFYWCKMTVVAFTWNRPTLAFLQHHVMMTTTVLLFLLFLFLLPLLLFFSCFFSFFSFFYLCFSSFFYLYISSLLPIYPLFSFYDLCV